jgi:nucleoside phosphorylase
MREYLKDEFQDSLLLEMEGGGAVKSCNDIGSELPIVIKSACDWATETKEKTWQPYCADVAAAFAVELALLLAANRSNNKS